MRYLCISLIVILLAFCQVVMGGTGNAEEISGSRSGGGSEEVSVHFYVGQDEGSTDYIFIGERSLYFALTFHENCSDYGFNVENDDIFKHGGLKDHSLGSAQSGSSHHFPLGLDSAAPSGSYEVKFHLNYTLENGTERERMDSYTFHYINAIELVDLHLPHGRDHDFYVTIRTHIEFPSVTVRFDSDGDIDINDEEKIYYSLPPGNHTFEADLRQGESFPDDQQEVAYRITASNGSRSVVITEYNINVDVQWEDEPEQHTIIFIVGGFSSVLVAIMIILFMRKKHGKWHK